MHYDGTLRGYFSTPIMTDKITGNRIEVNREMSPLDIKKLNQMYPCKTGSTCASVTFLEDKIRLLQDQNDKLQDQISSEKEENENLRIKIQQLEREKSELSRKQIESVNEIRDLTNENQNLQNSLDMCQTKLDCEGPIVGSNGLSLLKNQSEIQICQDLGIYDEPENSVLIIDRDSDGHQFQIDGKVRYNENAVITRGLSTCFDKTIFYNTINIGNKDKIITSFNTNGTVRYNLDGACGVTYQGLIHFFGGYSHQWNDDEDWFEVKQHLGFDDKRNFVKYKDLEIGFDTLQCSTFEISIPNSKIGHREVVLLCFDLGHKQNCYQYDDGELAHFADANEDHWNARLGKYKDQLITVGGFYNQKTEILDRSYNGEYKWTLGPDYNFSQTTAFFHYSMVNVPQMGSNEEYLLLIGGVASKYSDKVHKYNGGWSFFGNLQKPRSNHGSVFLNGRILIIGGHHGQNDVAKTEIWDISKSRFETEATWPELSRWAKSFAFIISDYINP